MERNENMRDSQTQNNMEKLTRELRTTRIFCLATSLLAILLLAGGGILYLKLQGMMERAEPMMEQVSQLDVEALNGTLRQLEESLGKVDWAQVSDTLGRLDVDALNTAIENLDTQELSTSLANLNKAVEAIQEAKEAIQSFLSVFKK